MLEITSPQNPRIKQLVKLRDDRRQRQREKQILVEGKYEIELALAGGMHPQQIIYCKELSSSERIKGINLEPIHVTRNVFEKISHREGPDGWLAVFPTPRILLDNLKLSPQPFLLLAQSVEKPGNLGAILRTADSVNLDGVLICDPRVELYNPNVIRASRGTIFTVPAVESDSESVYSWLREKKVQIIAATPQAQNTHTDVDYGQGVCIAVGTEDTGLTNFWLEKADLRVKIPMFGHVNSLNVSTSTAIILYEVIRQRQIA